MLASPFPRLHGRLSVLPGYPIYRYNGSVRKRLRANLYIRADADLIARAKRYAAEQKVSLSRLVEEHFLQLIAEDDLVEATISNTSRVSADPRNKRTAPKSNRSICR